jgi:hypothetical protein
MIYFLLLIISLYVLNRRYRITPIHFGFTATPDTYIFSNDIRTEIVFYKGGFIFSTTSSDVLEIEVYKPLTDTVESGVGYKRKSLFFLFTKKMPFLKINYTLKRTIPVV